MRILFDSVLLTVLSVYASETFTFIVGGTSFKIHSALVSQHSASLDRMINGPMAEAQNGYATLELVEESTMEQFIEWIYKGYYTPRMFQRDPNVSSPPSSFAKDGWKLPTNLPAAADRHGIASGGGADSGGEEPPPPVVDSLVEDDGWIENSLNHDWSLPSKKSKKPKTKKDLKRSFLLRRYLTNPGQSLAPEIRIRPNQEVYEDYTEVFLCHARLHVFADMYDIQPLKTLAFEQLHYTLGVFTLHRQRTGDIVALLRYVYANTIPEPHKDGNDLRTMLKEYVAYEMSALMKDEKFRELIIEDGGPLLADFMKMVAYRIH